MHQRHDMGHGPGVRIHGPLKSESTATTDHTQNPMRDLTMDIGYTSHAYLLTQTRYSSPSGKIPEFYVRPRTTTQSPVIANGLSSGHAAIPLPSPALSSTKVPASTAFYTPRFRPTLASRAWELGMRASARLTSLPSISA